MAISGCTSSALLLGDPQQLPQVSQNSHAEPVEQSALGWLMDGQQALPAQLGYFLADSYRMHPAVCQAVSDFAYDGRLDSAEPAKQRKIKDTDPGIQVVNVSHSGCGASSEVEANAVVDAITGLLGRQWTDGVKAPRPLSPADFIVVAPFNAQRALIEAKLREAGLDVPVGTVDKFQGKEAAVAILSMSSSSRDDVPRGMEFLLNRNRINVAISRAKYLSIIVKSEESDTPTARPGGASGRAWSVHRAV